jgi:hypothetical protein
MTSKEKIDYRHGLSVGGVYYDIRDTPEDNKRRCAYFRDRAVDKSKFEDCTNNSGISGKIELTDEEKRLLLNLGINDEFQQNHAYEMYLFFKELPNCQTSAALSLSAGCSTANYIIFSVMMEAEIESKKKLEKEMKPTISTDLMMMADKMIKGVGSMIRTTPRAAPETSAEAIARMSGIKKDTKENEIIIDIFTINV